MCKAMAEAPVGALVSSALKSLEDAAASIQSAKMYLKEFDNRELKGYRISGVAANIAPTEFRLAALRQKIYDLEKSLYGNR